MVCDISTFASRSCNSRVSSAVDLVALVADRISLQIGVQDGVQDCNGGGGGRSGGGDNRLLGCALPLLSGCGSGRGGGSVGVGCGG